MRILVCVKRVPAPGAKINLTADRRAIDTKHLGFAMSPHEECAVEEAVQIAQRTEGEVTILTLGPDEAAEQLRYGVSVGCARAIRIAAGDADLDPQATARAIVAAVGEVAHALDRPIINGIKSLETESGRVIARREVAAGFEQYDLPLPAVLGIKEGINLPRYPTMKGRLASRKVEVQRLEIPLEPGGQTLVRLIPPVEELTETDVLGQGAEAAGRVVDILEDLGALA